MNLNFAENFKCLRKEKKVTQEKCAEALGVSGQSVSRWELGICYPDVELLPSIANYFGVTVDHLLSNDTGSKEKDVKVFNEMIDRLSDETTERIDFVKEYCRKYPEDDVYAYMLVHAIKDHLIINRGASEAFMPLMLKTVQGLLESKYRNSVIEVMATVCDESELGRWLDMCPYKSGFSRRGCLSKRFVARGEGEQVYIQNGLEMLEVLAAQLDTRCPDAIGPHKKAEFQQSILRIIDSFGDKDGLPDGWLLFYAYKQLVLSACLFGCGDMDAGWSCFDSAMEKCRRAYSCQKQWLELGGELFSGIRVSRDWNYAIDRQGKRHKLFGIVNRSFYDPAYIKDLLTSPRWAWFDAVRGTSEFMSAVEFINSISVR